MITKAVLLVGGRGTRLAPLTDQIPKPMLKIAGKPVTEHQIIKAREAGIKEIVLATSYLAEVFEPYFGDGSRFGIKITYAVEAEPLGTGGAIRHAADLLELERDESVFIFNGDVISSHDLRAQYELHTRENAVVTLHLTEVEDARAYGCVPTESNGRVIDFLEKMENPISRQINAGCYIFSTAAIEKIPAHQVVSVERETFPSLLSSGAPVFGYCDSRYWIDMGTPESMIRASRDLVLEPGLSAATTGVSKSALVAHDCSMDPTSVVEGGSYVQEQVVIGPRSMISGSIIGHGAIIEGDVVIRDSYLAPKTRVTSGSKVESRVFGFTS